MMSPLVGDEQLDPNIISLGDVVKAVRMTPHSGVRRVRLLCVEEQNL